MSSRDKHSGILNNINRYVSLTESDESEFIAIVSTSKVKRRQFIVQPRFVCTHQTYVVEGALRSYYVGQDGVDHTLQFAVEDWFISDFNSYINQAPATIYVEALEDSTIQQIDYKAVEKLCSKNPKFEKYFRLVAQKAFAYAQRRIISKLDKTAEERLDEFISLYPNIVQRVPQYTIASYLGMTPEFLSKLRKKKSES